MECSANLHITGVFYYRSQARLRIEIFFITSSFLTPYFLLKAAFPNRKAAFNLFFFVRRGAFPILNRDCFLPKEKQKRTPFLGKIAKNFSGGLDFPMLSGYNN